MSWIIFGLAVQKAMEEAVDAVAGRLATLPGLGADGGPAPPVAEQGSPPVPNPPPAGAPPEPAPSPPATPPGEGGGPPVQPPANPPGGGGPPVHPPATPPGGGGPAAEAAEENARRIGVMLESLHDLDAAGISAEEIAAAGEAGRAELEQINTDVQAKIAELKASGALYTPEGQQALVEFSKVRLEEARGVIEKAAAEAEDKAAQTDRSTAAYEQVGGGSGGGGGAGGRDAGGDVGGGGDQTRPAATDPAAAAAQPAMGYGGMPGMGMGGIPGLGGIPGFGSGGGGMPGSGFIDPLASSLAGLADPQAGLGFTDDAKDPVGEGDDEDAVTFDDEDDRDSDSGSGEGDGETANDAATAPAAGGGAAGDGETGAAPPAAEAPKSTEVTLPSGEVTEARTPVGAEAVRAALNGASVSEAYQQAGITLPPAGTPVTEPIPPTQLQAGDVGVWKDHMVMALGNGNVLVSGQVQPLDSVGSGPDFLGWYDPTAAGDAAPAAV